MRTRETAVLVILCLFSFLGLSGTAYAVQTGGTCSGATADFYVSPSGNDGWAGTLPAPNKTQTNGPFATLNRAREAVQGMPGGKHIVMLRGGHYFLSAPVEFTSADSGNSSTAIEYSNYNCEVPIISGGKQITGWTNSNGNVWTATLSSSNYQNFEALFYGGGRRYRPRTTVSGFLYNAGPVYVPTESDNCSVQVGNQWECFDRFYFKGSDVASTYHSMALGDVEILDFEKWSMSRLRLQSVDTGNHIAYLTGPTYQDPLDNGFISGHRYMIENAKEALTQPGQWYLDRCTNPPSCTSSTGTWTLTYLAQTGENPSTGTVIVPQQSQLMVGNGLQYVTFQGLNFAHDNWLPPSTGLGDTQGIPSVTAAVSFTDSNNITINGCTLAHIQGWGIEFIGSGAVTTIPTNQVINSLLFDLGAGGIRIGKLAGSKDTSSSVAQFALVQNNLISSGGRIQPTGIGTGIWVGNSHDNTITHNEVRDFYSGAIGVGATWGISAGVGLAYNNVVSYNLAYNLGQGVTSDMGGIYFVTSANTGNQMLNNVVHDVTHDWEDSDGYGGRGLYFDQGTSNVIARNNLVYRTSSNSVFNNMADRVNDTYPQNNLVDNNIFAYSAGVTIQRGGDNPDSITFTHNISYFDRRPQVQEGYWSCYDVGGTGDPVPCPSRFVLDNNVYWTTAVNAFLFMTTDPNTNYADTAYSLAQFGALSEDAHSINVNPLFENPAYPNDNYTLPSNSPATSVGFVPFDYTQAGRTSTILNAPTSLPPAFPLQLMPITSF